MEFMRIIINVLVEEQAFGEKLKQLGIHSVSAEAM